MSGLSTALRVFGVIWISGVALVMLGGMAAYVYFAESKWQAWQKITDEMSPFALGDWLIKLMLFSPGIGAMMLAEHLRKRERGITAE
jgi:hypothetical protein